MISTSIVLKILGFKASFAILIYINKFIKLIMRLTEYFDISLYLQYKRNVQFNSLYQFRATHFICNVQWKMFLSDAKGDDVLNFLQNLGQFTAFRVPTVSITILFCLKLKFKSTCMRMPQFGSSQSEYVM